MKQPIYILLFFILLIINSVAQTITTSGLTFNPDTLYVNQGDTINFIFNNTHNAVEVDESTFISNGATSNNGFNIPYGGGSWIADSIKTYYYVCQPHVSMGMKGVIIAGTPPCNKNVVQELIGFNPNPVYDYWDWSYDTLTLINTSDCDIRVRPEFKISHDSLPINLTDFDLKWYNPLINFWPSLTYNINANGDAVGYWSTSPGDTSGYVIDQGTTQQVIIRVRFKPSANYGTYSAIWETKEVDSIGDFIQNLDLDSTSISFVDCSIFEVDSSYSTNINCFNNNDGNAGIISVKNGSNQYSYNWSNGDTTNAIINLNPGNYYCIITDINWQECTDSIAFLISEPTELISTPNVSQITCNGMCDGEIIGNITGGNLPYSFSWDGGVTWSYTDSIIDNLCQGNYILSIIDNNGCTENSSLISITEPNPINLNIDSLFNITSYGGNNGAIYISSNGGSGQLNTNWSSDNGFFSNNEDIINLLAGNYYLEITDINSCIYMDTIELTEPAPLSINLNWAVNTTCFDSCNGEINITANGGNPTYTYIWDGPNGFLSTNNYLTNLCYGTYIVTIDDGTSTIIDTFNIYQPQPITSNLTADSIICHNGFTQAEINVWGGTQPFTYLWSNNDTSYITNINHGSYTVTATDINGCWISENIVLTNPDSIISTTIDTGANCFGSNDGYINTSILLEYLLCFSLLKNCSYM